MFQRMSYVSGDASRLDDLITYVRSVVKPATDELAGNQGLAMWINRVTGDAIVATVWDDAATMDASEAAVMSLRDDGAGIIGGDAVAERFEIALVDTTTPHTAGNVMRLVRTHAEPAALADNLAWTRDTVVPLARAIDGYLSLVAGVDRATGAAMTSTTYRDAAAAQAELESMSHLEAAAIDRSIVIDSIVDYEVAIVGIRAPIPTPMMMPAQRTVDLTESMHTAQGR